MNRSIAAMAEEGVEVQHEHYCPSCERTYSGYNALCAEKELSLCGRCIAKLFAAPHGGLR